MLFKGGVCLSLRVAVLEIFAKCKKKPNGVESLQTMESRPALDFNTDLLLNFRVLNEDVFTDKMLPSSVLYGLVHGMIRVGGNF